MPRYVIVVACLSLFAAGPARADILGTLVNEVMSRLLSDEPAGAATEVPDFRRIPEDAREGVMSPPVGRQVRIDGAELLLAPGCRIRDVNNRIVLPGTVIEPAPVRYTLDIQGNVRRVWLLAAR